MTIQNPAGVAVAQFWNGSLLAATLNGSLAVATTTHLNGEVVIGGALSGLGITTLLSPYATNSALSGKENLIITVMNHINGCLIGVGHGLELRMVRYI